MKRRSSYFLYNHRGCTRERHLNYRQQTANDTASTSLRVMCSSCLRQTLQCKNEIDALTLQTNDIPSIRLSVMFQANTTSLDVRMSSSDAPRTSYNNVAYTVHKTLPPSSNFIQEYVRLYGTFWFWAHVSWVWIELVNNSNLSIKTDISINYSAHLL